MELDIVFIYLKQGVAKYSNKVRGEGSFLTTGLQEAASSTILQPNQQTTVVFRIQSNL